MTTIKYNLCKCGNMKVAWSKKCRVCHSQGKHNKISKVKWH